MHTRATAFLAILAGLPLLQGCYGLEAELSIRILNTATNLPRPWVKVTGNTEPPPSNCTLPHSSCGYKIYPDEFQELVLEAIGDDFDRWECSNRTSIPALRQFSERSFSGFANEEQCAAIFCPTRDVELEVDAGIAGVSASVKVEHPQNGAFLIRNGRVSIPGSHCTAPDSTCFARVCEGVTVDLVAVEDTLRFVGFDGECGVPVAGDPLRSRLVVDGHKSCTATFAALELSVSVTGNGRVVSTSGGIDCSAADEPACVRPFPLNRNVGLLAQPDPGASFVAWGEDCAAGGSSHTAQVVIEGNRQCTAEFDALAVAPGAPGVIELVTIAPDGGDIPSFQIGGALTGDEGHSDLSADGRSVVFRRPPAVDPDPDSGILLRHLTADATQHLVLTDDFRAEGKQLSVNADGRFVAFVSGSTSVTHNAPGDDTYAAFVYGSDSQELVKVSVDDPDHSVALVHSGYGPAVLWTEISANGRYVSFAAVRILGGVLIDSAYRIYVRDTCAGAPSGCIESTRLVSVRDDGAVPSFGQSRHPSISADGRFVAFVSTSTLLMPGGADDQGLTGVVFVHDRDADGNRVFDEFGGDCSAPPCVATTPISIAGSGFEYPRLSDSGRFVGYTYSGDFALAAAFGGSFLNGQGVLVHDRVAGTTRGLFGPPTVGPAFGDVDFSSDGRFIAFSTESQQIAGQDTCFGAPAGCALESHLVSVNAAGQPADGTTVDARISGDGRLVSFGGWAFNLVPGELDFAPDLYAAASGFVRTPGGRPDIDDLPVNLQAGSPAQLLPIDGSGFVPGVSVFWGGEPRPTIYINETRIEFRVTAADLAAPAFVSLEVRNPGGSDSGPVRLEVLE